jgi:hypothetical protein
MSLSTATPGVQSTPLTDEIIDDVRRIRDVLAGALAIMQPDLARSVVGKASAIAAHLVDRLERSIMVEAERARTEAQASKNIAPAVSR